MAECRQVVTSRRASSAYLVRDFDKCLILIKITTKTSNTFSIVSRAARHTHERRRPARLAFLPARSTRRARGDGRTVSAGALEERGAFGVFAHRVLNSGRHRVQSRIASRDAPAARLEGPTLESSLESSVQSRDETREEKETSAMYKKNSILDRPRRPPSARNVESAPIEHERAMDKQARLSARYRNYAELDGYASRNAWSDPARLSSTRYDTLHGLQTVVGAKGLETAFRADVDFRSGVAKVPAPWERAENYPEDDPLADQAWPASPGRGVSPSSPYRPASPGTRSPRLLRNHQIVVPEDDPNDLNTQRKHVPPPSRLDGVYDPINHRWVVMPSDASVLDREAMPPGLRSKGNMYHP